MDALSLLCSLHADGPSTRRRLAALGLGSLAELSRTPVEELARALGSAADGARRFQREAAALARRIGDEPPGPGPAAATEVALVPGALAGLDGPTCTKLRAAGVTTLESLSARGSIDLARRLEVAYVDLLDLTLAAATWLRERREQGDSPGGPRIEALAARSGPGPGAAAGPERGPEPKDVWLTPRPGRSGRALREPGPPARPPSARIAGRVPHGSALVFP